ncbi:Acyl carrier protein [uncultured Alphaproteobacteria bacterium]|jgi:acyl carrier protein|uniref:Acyl carrier protein n=1 Tax=uncultured Alphaproteobacteria bacterium TaxID=91750 RepID=A0A212K7W7_9PROT|nr:Acyl carrier protein [uncultured Alphaproteobacteria bacterium]
MPVDMAIIDIIITQLRKITPPGTAITPQSSIMGDLGLDSLTVMNFVMWLEDEFDVSVPMDRMVGIQTVTDLAETLQSLGVKVPE